MNLDILKRNVDRVSTLLQKLPFFVLSPRVLYICTNVTFFVVISQHMILLLVLPYLDTVSDPKLDGGKACEGEDTV